MGAFITKSRLLEVSYLIYMVFPVIIYYINSKIIIEGCIKMKTIFVVDDNGVNLLMVEQALLDHFEVITMSSAATMFELFDTIIPDMILLDIMMPDMNGFEVLAQLKSNAQYAKIPVIFLTSKNDADTEALGYEKGVTGFIKKPFSKLVLLSYIKNILEL